MTTTTALVPVHKLVSDLAHQRIGAWQRGYTTDQAKAVAARARLSREAGKTAAQVFDLWDLVDLDALQQARADGRPLSEAELERAEEALLMAFTLWALHQQSRSTGVHQLNKNGSPRGLGSAVRRLMPASEIDDALLKRLVRAGKASDLPTLAQRLRDIVLLLRRADAPLDYALLAGQLYQWQWPGGTDAVRTAWGRSFHAWREKDDKTAQEPQAGA
ncbi:MULTISPECIES: type I-E CRISPR-associated protein Cse2/CasB [Streptomyces]|uniref:CRISPR-associated protein n=1 Tax=Streptomyces viridochromogenes TaxID=1938 RepID=A0A0L8L183_STRVR|nr:MULTISPECIES: type I-E CRISPR-associated protein Cse2/CasB [Streptomyces]KOG31855.1 CRISPR-associated protein [Streptomyces viridochromogenes]